MSKLSENIRILRLLRGFSVRQIAQKIGCSPGSVLNWESGRISPPADAVEVLCNIYQIAPNQLLGWEPCPEIDNFQAEQKAALDELNKLKAEKFAMENRIKALNDLLSRSSK